MGEASFPRGAASTFSYKYLFKQFKTVFTVFRKSFYFCYKYLVYFLHFFKCNFLKFQGDRRLFFPLSTPMCDATPYEEGSDWGLMRVDGISQDRVAP
jgi:hypothetical protein